MNKIAILDFGSQYTQLIARRLRELEVYSEIFPYHVPIEKLKEFNPKGIVLSGGPASVSNSESPYRSIKELRALAPLLGLCYGMQLIVKDLGGKVSSGAHREYGLTHLKWESSEFVDLNSQVVWMSHGDTVTELPDGFKVLAQTESGVMAVIQGPGYLGFQFHPEVSHTQNGDVLLLKFLKDCNITPDWRSETIYENLKKRILEKVPDNEKVLCALSGGVDSSVAGVFLTKILGKDRVHCIFVNNGLLRKNEFEDVLKMYEGQGLNVEGVDAEDLFLERLKGVSDPEQKRKIIGKTFIDVFEKHMPSDVSWLAQGTLYPDVIESLSVNGGHVTIKSHHNVGGLPEKMKLKLLEPFRELFKDEVRKLGRDLNIPKEIIDRHPFPGPGLAVRVIGDITKEKLEILRDCDAIYIQELINSGFYSKIWQAFSVLLPVHTVGVQGDGRTYERSLALRAVTSQDGMTADWFMFPPEFLRKVSNKITNDVKRVNRVVYDITSKPPGTIEWE